jgi:Domain of unknown function (DUF5916)/Carbohydrate family 9 binding domain-like
LVKFADDLKKHTVIFLFFIVSLVTLAQNQQQLHIYKTDTKITIDGVLDENIWTKCEAAKDFWKNFPSDSSLSSVLTVTYLTYDDKYLYVGAKCFDTAKGKYVINSLRRDNSFQLNDCFGIYFDTYNDKTNGLAFGVNAYGVQRDGLFSNGGGQGTNTVWDAAWLSETKIYPNRYDLEMAIPFRWLRFNSTLKEWGLNIVRNDIGINEISSWNKIPRNFNVSSLAFTGKLIWDQPPKRTGKNISLIPFINNSLNRDYVGDTKFKNKFNFGGDAKIALTSGLNLDLTINPDFSQVEVDRQQVNLTRFNIQFPEQRNFFIENQDLFGNFGFRSIRPFFSRQIGIENGNLIPIYGGVRLSGKATEKLRVGLIDMQTAPLKSLDVLSQNFLVASLQRQIFARSNVNAIFVNKQAFTDKGEQIVNKYNRVVGLEYFYQAPNNQLIAKFSGLRTFTPQNNADAISHMSFIRYQTQNLELEWNHEYVGKNVIAEAGFVNRNSIFNRFTNQLERFTYWRLEPRVNAWYYPENSKINKHGPEMYSSIYFDDKLKLTDDLKWFAYLINFKNTATIDVQLKLNYTVLKYSTSEPFGGFTVLDSGAYTYPSLNVFGTTNTRKVFSFNYGAEYGDYFNGKKLSLKGDLNYRFQPYANFTINYSLDRLQTKENQQRDIHLLGAKADVSFTKSIFLTTYFQYNTLANNFNVNARFQWRYKPLSDLFLVYTDNYNSQNIFIKNRAVVLKWVYWFTV